LRRRRQYTSTVGWEKGSGEGKQRGIRGTAAIKRLSRKRKFCKRIGPAKGKNLMGVILLEKESTREQRENEVA